MSENGDWKVAALLRSDGPGGDSVWARLPGVELQSVLAAAGVEVTVRGADRLMVRVQVDGPSAEDAEARVEQQLQSVACLQGLPLASIHARRA